MFRFVPQQFFPDSTRPELMVDMELAEGASLHGDRDAGAKLEAMLKAHAGIDNYVAYVGTGSPRFYLPLDQQLPAAELRPVRASAPRTSKRASRCATG